MSIFPGKKLFGEKISWLIRLYLHVLSARVPAFPW